MESPASGHLVALEPFKRQMAEQDIPYLTEEAPRAIQQSLDGLARIARIVQAMKVFGHPGGEERAAVDLNATIQNTVVVAQGEWKHVAEVVMDLAPDLPKVSACLGEMNQVFLNLVSERCPRHCGEDQRPAWRKGTDHLDDPRPGFLDRGPGSRQRGRHT